MITLKTSADVTLKTDDNSLTINSELGNTADTPPIAHWKMNDNDTNTTVVDSIGTNNGTAQQNTDQITTTGKINTALSFNGTSDYIHLNSGTLINTNYSVSVWIYANVVSSYQMFLGDITEADYFGLLSGRLRVFDNGSGITFTNTPLTADEWYHVVFVRKGTNWIAYINGGDGEVKADTGTPQDITIADIGAGWSGGLYRWNGKIDDVRIYDYALSKENVENLYNNGAGTEGDTLKRIRTIIKEVE